MKCPFVIKTCKKCKKILVAYDGNFYRKNSGKYKLDATCKECKNIYQKEYYNENKNEINKNKKQYQKEYYSRNKEKILDNQKQYKKDNSEKGKEIRHNCYEKNKEKVKEYGRQWVKENPEKIFNRNSNRRKLEKEQGSGITKEQWLEMMNFFDWKCAYSGESLNAKNRSIDHIVPLDKDGEHEIWNCVPMLKSYNISKFTNDMLDWYVKQVYFSEDRLNKIYKWIEYAENKYKIKRDDDE